MEWWPPSTNGAPIPYGEPIETLREWLTRAAPACWCAYPAIARVGSEAARTVLLAQAESPDWSHRRLAAEWLPRLGAPPVIEDAILRLLNDSEGPVHRTAAHATAALRVTAAIPRLIRMLSDPVRVTREDAAIALGQLGGPEAFHALSRLFRAAKSADDRKRLGRALFDSLDQSTGREAFEILVDDTHPRHRK